MATGAADVYKAIVTAWTASGLDATFKALWRNPLETEFLVLNDEEALPKQPFPYAVMQQFSGVRQSRMTGGASGTLKEVLDYDVRINVHARAVSGDSRTAKEIAAYLAEEIKKVFGGHPTETPSASPSLDNGAWLGTFFENDFYVRTGEDESQCTLVYTVKVDVPVLV